MPEVPQPGESEKPLSGEAARTLSAATRGWRGWPWNKHYLFPLGESIHPTVLSRIKLKTNI